MGILYVVATPIGNLEDVTLRALRVLREADGILAEDTRRARILLDRHGIAARPRSLHAHNEAARSAEALARLAAGETLALISDAGTPLVSDPGERLVAAAAAAGHTVVPVPGASAVMAALSACGLPADAFLFVGFLPRKAGPRRARLADLAARPETLVLFESPRRVPATLRALADALGERRACLARELTKRHEELARGPLSALAERFAEVARGEVTIVVEGARREAEAAAPGADDLDAEIRRLLAAGRSARDIAALLSADGRHRRRDVYHRAVSLREDS